MTENTKIYCDNCDDEIEKGGENYECTDESTNYYQVYCDKCFYKNEE